MGPVDFIAIGVIALIVGAATLYIIKAKRSGKKCIGCPDSSSCSGKCSGSCQSCSCACGKDDSEEEEF